MLGHDRPDASLSDGPDGEHDSLASLAGLLAAVARTPRVPPVVPGTEVAGRYLVVGVVGAGGMGVVYRARDQQLERDVAIKICSRVSEDETRRLLGEALALARLSHPNVIHVYEVGRHADDLFIVMELVAGPTLRSWLDRGAQPWRDVVRAYLDAAAGLHAVHRAGLVHGDFKPDNVVVGADGRVRLVDFGLARVGDDALPGPGGAGGTPRYMAPEVRAGWFPSQLSDQYSFCVALSEGLGGRATRGLERALARGRAEDAFQRHESMANLRTELAATLGRRRRALTAAAAFAAVLLLGVAGAWVTERAEANRTRAARLRSAALELDVEQGRRELANGNVPAALVYLAAALDGGVDRPAVRFLLARGLAAIEQTFAELPLAGTAPVSAVLFLRLGPRALVGDATGRVLLFDVASGRLLRAFLGHRGRIVSLTVDEPGLRLLSASADGTARLWDAESGALTAELTGHRGPLTGARFLPDGRRIMTAGADGTVRVWDGGRELFRLEHAGPVTAALPARELIVSASEDGTARIWNGRTGAAVRVLRHPQGVVALDADATRVATGSRDGMARVWDARTGALVAELRHGERVGAVALLPGDRLLTACDDGVARVWDLSSSAVATSFTGHTGPLTALQATPDGTRVVTASSDGTVRLWDLATGGAIAALNGHKQGVPAVAYAASENLVLSGSDDGTARVWSVSSSGFLGSLSPDERRYRAAWFAGRDGVVAVDDRGAAEVFRARGSGWEPIGAPLPGIAAAAVSADGTELAMAGPRDVELWDLELRERMARLPAARAAGVLFSDDGSALVAYGEGATIFPNGSCSAPVVIPPGPSPAVTAALAPRADRLVLAHADGTLSLWDARVGRRLAALPRPAGGVVDLRFDPSGTLLALGGNDAGVEIWDAFTGRLRRRLGRHGAPVVAVRFSPDGALLYSLGSDRKVRVWDLATGAELAVLLVEAFGGLEVSPDGTRLLVHQSLGRVSFWDVSREPRTHDLVAKLVHCLVPLQLAEADHLVPRAPDPACQE